MSFRRIVRSAVDRAAKARCALVWGLLQLVSLPSQAAEWSMEPSFRVKTEYNDNILLTPAPHPAVWGITVSPDVRFTGATERLSVTGGINLSFDRYFDQPQLNANNHALILRSSYRTERDLFGLNVDSVRDPTLVSELLETGAVVAYRQRNRLSVTPSWTRALTESTSVGVTYTYTAVRYGGGPEFGVNLIDYHDQSAALGWQRALSERSVVTLTAYYDQYESDPATFRAETYGIQAGYTHRFSETLRGSFSVGGRRTQSTIASQALVCEGVVIAGLCFGTITVVPFTTKEKSSGYTLDALVEKQLETSTFTGHLSRQLNPSGVGTLIETDRLSLGWSRDWSAALRTMVDAAAYQSRYVGSVRANSDTRYLRIEPRVSWRFAEGWELLAGYRYSWTRAQGTGVEADANVAYVSVSYAWPKLSMSR